MSETKCYTFYSYKGGSGRSTTAMNTVYHLISELGASPESPILLVDVDLESAGLTFYFNQEDRFLSDISLGGAAFDTSCVLSGQTKPRYHFKESGNQYLVTQEVVDEFERGGFRNIETLFSDVRLTQSKWELLKRIAKAYTERRSATADNSQELLNFFDVSKFISGLNRINNAEEKERFILDFLPTSVYTDISKYFGQEPGTVRFLGVDTKQNTARVARGYGSEAIENLLAECNRRGYKAIVFDSGAGTQSSADLLQYKSDVVVYCMRPTIQFAKGTKTAIRTYSGRLNISGAKVILLPTAVSWDDENGVLSQDCFSAISSVAREAGFIDDTFCMPQTALCEVGLFKWREQILGVNYDPSVDNRKLSPISDDVKCVLQKYGDESTLPLDAKKAYETYRRLAKRIVEIS